MQDAKGSVYSAVDVGCKRRSGCFVDVGFFLKSVSKVAHKQHDEGFLGVAAGSGQAFLKYIVSA